MPHAKQHDMNSVRDPKKTDAYLMGGGIASLAAATHLIQDARVLANQIHIIESVIFLVNQWMEAQILGQDMFSKLAES